MKKVYGPGAIRGNRFAGILHDSGIAGDIALKLHISPADEVDMLGITSPSDILDAVMTAQKAEERQKQTEALRKKGVPVSVEDLLLSSDPDFLRPDRAFLRVFDENRDREEEQRTGRRRSAFDDIIAAKVAAAVGPYYSQPGAPKLEVMAKDPFSPASAIGSLRPRISKEALRIAEENGFPTSVFLGGSIDQALLSASARQNLETAEKRMNSGRGLARYANRL